MEWLFAWKPVHAQEAGCSLREDNTVLSLCCLRLGQGLEESGCKDRVRPLPSSYFPDKILLQVSLFGTGSHDFLAKICVWVCSFSLGKAKGFCKTQSNF